jgi:two-component system cell cycle response regulator
MDISMNKKRSVLIVDDDPRILDILKIWFTEEGYACETVADGKEALEIIEKNTFDFIFTDIVLPGINGLELTEKIKALKPSTKVVVMTGFSVGFSFDTAIESGASDFIKKPFTLQELMARMTILNKQEDILNESITDELTGVYNRKGFYTLASHLLKVAKRNRQGIFLLYAELDGMKEINDNYGHKEGDLLLTETADMLSRHYRESDIIARVGGDEFVVFPVGTAADVPQVISERLEKNLKLHNEQSGTKHKISLSWGTAFFGPESSFCIDDLLAQADKAMHEMKMKRKIK